MVQNQNPPSSSLSASASSSSASIFLGNFYLNKNLNSKKPIDDQVWGEIADQECPNTTTINKRQPTLGEKTLEKFLLE